ncbi:MAG: hypothetical protein K2K55_02995 [Duncaniella sp.]|nr:hypothetical protein [Duncaniella sp.]
MVEIFDSLPVCLAAVPGLFFNVLSGLIDASAPKEAHRKPSRQRRSPLPHADDHSLRCPPLPEEGISVTAEATSDMTTQADAEAAAEQQALAAHFARWRQAVIDAEVIGRREDF